jgi:photosystem I P700 chlorophyll a apoprotein A2
VSVSIVSSLSSPNTYYRSAAVLSILWSSHLLHVCTASYKGLANFTGILYSFLTFNWFDFASYAHHDSPLKSDSYYLYKPILTFCGGISSDSFSLPITDISHHHLSIGILLLWVSCVFKSLSKCVPISFAHTSTSLRCSNLAYSGRTPHLSIAIALFSIGSICSLVSHHFYSINPYPFLSFDIVASMAVFVHHQYIASIMVLGSLAHISIFIIRDYFHANCNSLQYSIITR